MFEVDNKLQRHKFLCSLATVEHSLQLEFDGSKVQGEPIYDDIDRTSPQGKTSAVHFIEFKFSGEEKAAFDRAVSAGSEVCLAITHDNYAHKAVLKGTLLQQLVKDLSA
uniref:Uncharacterized protein n=1 Tax=Palpitomonas bilix TaxID=652834 RepID=A0A7S3D612_9EUKA|mmetsp:Transcript_23819/g.60149  ORF Transcript_23819/g.60149 Transcript_23819/m.60149 type:complete len:109 (+) Transcript_23819:603-929(+)